MKNKNLSEAITDPEIELSFETPNPVDPNNGLFGDLYQKNLTAKLSRMQSWLDRFTIENNLYKSGWPLFLATLAAKLAPRWILPDPNRKLE